MTWPGCEVTIAESGVEALRQFEQGPWDLIVLDVSMPPPDGFEILRRWTSPPTRFAFAAKSSR